MDTCFDCEYVDINSSTLDHGAGEVYGSCENEKSPKHKSFFQIDGYNSRCSLYKKQRFMKLPKDLVEGLIQSIKRG